MDSNRKVITAYPDRALSLSSCAAHANCPGWLNVRVHDSIVHYHLTAKERDKLILALGGKLVAQARGWHRDDAMNRRCNACEHKVRQCICDPKIID